MKLNRVSLQGFLAHYGQEIDGAIAPLEFDFTDSNLWLMHGTNGSGKSSVFDAITFALFDKARGSQLSKLVNDRSQVAHVEVEFENQGERYRVKRSLKLKKNRDGHQSSQAEVSRWNAEENRWIVEENVGKIRDWTQRTLRVSYENFVSSVILEQGRADRFLSATPRERRDQLMELLDLSVYEKISAAANARRNQSRTELKIKENQLKSCAPVAPEDVARAEQAASDAQTRVIELNEAAKRAQKVCDDAVLVAELESRIAAKIAQQNDDAAILADAQTIENAARQRDELNAILPSLRALQNARALLASAQTDWKSSRVKLESAQARARTLAPLVEQTRAAIERAAGASTQAQLRAKSAELSGARAQDDAEKLKQIEELEDDVAACERALEPHRVWLNRAEWIESRREQIENLSAIIEKVRPIEQASRKLERAQRIESDAQIAHEAALHNARAAQTRWEKAAQLRRELDGADDELKTQRANLAAKLELNRGILRARDELGHADECPTCGSPLDDPDACERIAREREMLRREVESWQRRWNEIEGELHELESDKRARAQDEQSAREAFDEAGKIAVKTEAQLQFARGEVDEKNRELAQARAVAGAWAGEDLASLERRIAELNPATIADDWQALQNARGVALQTEATARACRAQLQRLPAWDDEKRRNIGELQRDLQGVLTRANEELKSAQSATENAQTQHRQAQEDFAHAQSDAKIAQGLENQKATAAHDAKAALNAQLDKLSPAWKEHDAAHHDENLNELNARFEELGAVAARAGELREARQRVRDLENEIGWLRAQIEAIAPEHRIEAGRAQIQLDQARGDLSDAESELQNAREQAFKMRSAREILERTESERNTAAIEAERDHELAEALGRDGLQARIIKQAQQNLRGAANGILGRLSKGQWQIDLRAAGEDDSELEIIARDEARGGHERTFDALSGGERFRVAISLAIAIGQMASGGAPMNTLVIDEGFGALDEENRGLMVDNLRHLSQHELKNGRIIVVSHQNDVQDFFGSRYSLSRDPSGYAQVEMTVG